MMTFFRRAPALLAAVSLTLGISVTTVRAQLRVDETVSTRVGDIVEIVAVHADPAAQVAWILDRDGAFVQAERGADFQVRLTDPGSYTLSATISDAGGTPIAQRTFALEVRSRDGQNAPPPADRSGGGVVVTTMPPAANGSAAFTGGMQLLTIAPNRADAVAYRIDLNPGRDTNGDGNPANDDELPNSFFAKNRVPLSLWFADTAQERSIAATAILADGSSVTQTLRILTSGGDAAGSGAALASASSSSIATEGLDGLLSITQGEAGALQFSIPQIVSLQVPVLTYWSFGDGTESLVTAPSHRYQQSGTYEVRVRVVDLRTGKTMFEAARNATVQAYVPSSSASSSSQASSAAASSQAAVPSPASGGGVSLAALLPIVRILVVLLGVILLVVIVVWIVGKILRRGGQGFQRTLETIDARFASPGVAVEEAQPLTISPQADTTTEEPIKEEEPPVVATVSPPPAEPVVEIENAPSWLKKGIEAAPTVQEPAPPPTAPAVEAAPLAPTPPPSPPPGEKIDIDNAPSWLRAGLGSQMSAEAPPASMPVEPVAPVAEPPVEPAPPARAESPAAPDRAQEAPAAPAAEEPVSFSAPPPAENVNLDTAPPWLRAGLGAQASQTQQSALPTDTPAPAPAESPAPERTPPPVVIKEQPPAAPLPPEPAQTTPAAPARLPELPVSAPAAAGVSPAPAGDHASITQGTATTDASSSAETERDRERKRLKRKRYRENLKRRKLGEKNDETPPATPTPPQPVGTQATVPQEENATPPPLTIPVPAPPQPQSKEPETASQEATAAVTPAAAPQGAVPPGDAPIAATPSVDVSAVATPPTSPTVSTDPLSTPTPETPSTTAASVSPPEPTRSNPTPPATPKDDDVLFMVRAEDVQDEAQPGTAK